VSPSASIVWLRDDLRLADNPALAAAITRGGPIAVVYVLDEKSPRVRPLGGASRWWLHGSLTALSASLEAIGGSLALRRGTAAEVIPALIDELDAGAVFWNRRYSAAKDTDAALKEQLRSTGIEVRSFKANALFEPWEVHTAAGTPFQVFTPFWRACLDRGVHAAPMDAPAAITGIAAPSDRLDDWRLLPTAPDWAAGLRETWTPGEQGAAQRLETFASNGLADYHLRDLPAADTTSHLSPHLRFGEISPLQVWHRIEHGALDGAARPNAAGFLRQLGWRDFNTSVLFANPALATRNLHAEFDRFAWGAAEAAVLEAWQTGRTGIPLVDAGMRELWHTGYMHNRVRMVVASLLVKNLLIDWRIGEQWFWDTLVDAEDANNAGNWQWVAGSGADAAPYFRVFNPELQAAKFDSEGDYVRRWIPEFGTPDYPAPIVDLKTSRLAALAAYDEMRRSR
jgi:deoxyribodipyrimidine photo-lyase